MKPSSNGHYDQKTDVLSTFCPTMSLFMIVVLKTPLTCYCLDLIQLCFMAIDVKDQMKSLSTLVWLAFSYPLLHPSADALSFCDLAVHVAPSRCFASANNEVASPNRSFKPFQSAFHRFPCSLSNNQYLQD